MFRESYSLHLGGLPGQELTAVCSVWRRRNPSPGRGLPCIHGPQGWSVEVEVGSTVAAGERREQCCFKTQAHSREGTTRAWLLASWQA